MYIHCTRVVSTHHFRYSHCCIFWHASSPWPDRLGWYSHTLIKIPLCDLCSIGMAHLIWCQKMLLLLDERCTMMHFYKILFDENIPLNFRFSKKANKIWWNLPVDLNKINIFFLLFSFFNPSFGFIEH